jgi:hypothetical protein
MLSTALFWVITLRNNQEERISHLLCGGSLKSRVQNVISTYVLVVLEFCNMCNIVM